MAWLGGGLAIFWDKNWLISYPRNVEQPGRSANSHQVGSMHSGKTVSDFNYYTINQCALQYKKYMILTIGHNLAF